MAGDELKSEDVAIWTEKYRPHKFSDVKGQDEIVARVKALVEKKNLPHLLFAGPAGVGKTTLSLVIARELFGNDWRENFLELNASDERGIDVVRVKVKDFARTRAIDGVPFKIIYMDECDALTKEAQQALRRTMENYTQTCRFILSCNYSSKIIDPIQSRCSVFRFKPLPKEQIFHIIDTIAKHEHLQVDEKAKEALHAISEGDCRKLENIMQSCAAMESKITEKIVYTIASAARPKEIKEVLESCANGDFGAAKNKLLDTMLNHGLAGLDVIRQIQAEIWNVSNIDMSGEKAAGTEKQGFSVNRKKLEMVKECGEAEFRMTEGADEFIQLETLLAKFILIAKV